VTDSKPGAWNGAGETNLNSRMTWQQVDQMRAEYDAGLASGYALAGKYGISTSQAHNIVSRKHWTKRPESLVERQGVGQ
jgi:hypothetical protein